MVNVPALETDATAFSDVVGGDDATVATASNGRQTSSMQKVLKDQIRWKPPILWTVSVNVTDILQPYTSPIDGFAYGPAAGKVPFTAVTDPSTDPTNWFLVQGYAQGSGVDLDMAGGAVKDAGKINSNDTTDATSPTVASMQTDGGLAVVMNSFLGGDLTISRSSTGIVQSLLANTSDTPSADSRCLIQVAGPNAGDPFTRYRAIGVRDWTVGIDTSDGGKFKISDSATVGLNTALTFNPATQDAIFGGDVSPSITETQDLGSPASEWDNIFLQNAPTVSDKRKKNDLGNADSMVAVMKLLNPRIFSRKSRVVLEALPEQTFQRQRIEIIKEQHQKIIISNGTPVLTMVTVEIEKPIFKMITLKDENGVSVKNDDGKVVKHPVPVMEDYIISAQDEVTVAHGRPHTGFMAQDVKQAMTDAGINDWAGYAYHNDQGEDTHVLRLLEFIAPMLSYIQELEGRVENLENRNNG